MPTIDLIAGARPNFMKIAPIIRALRDSPINYRLVHTGQHYDRAMSGAFFEDLGIPDPDVNLAVGSGTHAQQTAEIMVRYEKLLMESPVDACLVVGDVNSTLACAVVARKLGVPVGHVEGGIRSCDWTMPEEINRIVTDSISNWFFTTSETANSNLRKEGKDDNQVFFVGNTMIDTLRQNEDRLLRPDFWQEHGLEPGGYLVLTMHRPANVDGEETLIDFLRTIRDNANGLPVIFPVHPRTAGRLLNLDEPLDPIRCVDPLGYLQFNFLVKHAKAVITDSGGITEEATVLGVPCLTLRDNTERPETITIGTNELVGTNPANLAPALERLFAGDWKQGSIPELWDGKAAERIVGHLERLL